jgi:hypothetical protein
VEEEQERTERTGRGQQIEPRRDPHDRLVRRSVKAEEQRGERANPTPRRQAPAQRQHEQRVQDVEQDVREVELSRVAAGKRPVEGVGQEAERPVVLEELGAEEAKRVGRAIERPQAVQDHEVIAHEPRLESRQVEEGDESPRPWRRPLVPGGGS